MLDRTGCLGLDSALKAYEITPWEVVSKYILYLTGTAVALTILGIGALATPSRLAPRVLLGAILFAQIMVLAPYFILDGRRRDMGLRSFRITNEAQLKEAVKYCSDSVLKREIKLNRDLSVYNFKEPIFVWEGHVMVVCTCVAGMLMSRILYLSVGRRTSDNETRGNRLLIHIPRPHQFSRPNRDIDATLAALRAPEESRDMWCDTQCAICLDNLDSGNITKLKCSHLYHEKCLGSWLRSANAGGNCPMCKASVWDHENGVMDMENNIESNPDSQTDASTSTNEEDQIVNREPDRVHRTTRMYGRYFGRRPSPPEISASTPWNNNDSVVQIDN